MKVYTKDEILESRAVWIEYQTMRYFEMCDALMQMTNIDSNLTKEEILHKITKIEEELKVNCDKNSRKYLRENKKQLIFKVNV